MNDTKRSHFGLKVLANFFVFLSLLLLIEIFAWVFLHRQGSNLESSWRLNHTWKPNSSWEHTEWANQLPEYSQPYTHHYNSQAWLESYDVPKQKPENTYRIFYLGDSFTEGTVPMELSLPSLVESDLNSQLGSSDKQIEIINTGTSSYSPTLFYLLIRYYLLEYHPDLFIVNVDMTDDFDDWKYSHTLLFDEQGDPKAAPPRGIFSSDFIDTPGGALPATLPRKLHVFLTQNSFFYNLIFALTPPAEQANTSSDFLYKRWAWCDETWNNATEKNVQRTLDMLRKIVALATERGVRIALSSVPHYEQYSQNGRTKWSSRPHKEIQNLAYSLQVPYIDAYSALRPIFSDTPQERYFYKGDMHLNPKGYREWAKIHSEFLKLEEHSLLPRWFYKKIGNTT